MTTAELLFKNSYIWKYWMTLLIDRSVISISNTGVSGVNWSFAIFSCPWRASLFFVESTTPINPNSPFPAKLNISEIYRFLEQLLCDWYLNLFTMRFFYIELIARKIIPPLNLLMVNRLPKFEKCFPTFKGPRDRCKGSTSLANILFRKFVGHFNMIWSNFWVVTS